jgi:hypothetical protein
VKIALTGNKLAYGDNRIRETSAWTITGVLAIGKEKEV